MSDQERCPTAVEGLVEQCAYEIVQTLMPSMDAEMFIRHTKKVGEIVRAAIRRMEETK